MDFEQKPKRSLNEQRYHIENLRHARDFSKQLLEEMGELVRSIVLFGSNATNDKIKKSSDIDILIVLNNVSVYVTAELREAYRVIVDKISSKVSDKLHILTINLSDLWDMSRKGDPVLTNILRYGYPLFDRDLVEPLQYLLEIGKIRPTREAVHNYLSRSETLIEESIKHLEDSLLDLYYGVVDCIHANLMSHLIIPPSPKDMPKYFRKACKKHVELGKHSTTIDEFYKLYKDIEHKKIKVTGSLYDKMRKKADKLLLELNNYTKRELKKRDQFEL